MIWVGRGLPSSSLSTLRGVSEHALIVGSYTLAQTSSVSAHPKGMMTKQSGTTDGGAVGMTAGLYQPAATLRR